MEQGFNKSKVFLALISTAVASGLIWFSADNSLIWDSHVVLQGVQNKQEFVGGAIAPTFTANDIHGKQQSLRDYSGKVVLIHLWATWCPPCVAEIGSLQRLQQLFADKGFSVLSINVDSGGEDEAVLKFVAQNGITFPVLRDPKVQIPRIYGATGFPESFFVDRSGKFISINEPGGNEQNVRVVGDRPWDAPGYVKLVEELLSRSSTVAESSSS